MVRRRHSSYTIELFVLHSMHYHYILIVSPCTCEGVYLLLSPVQSRFSITSLPYTLIPSLHSPSIRLSDPCPTSHLSPPYTPPPLHTLLSLPYAPLSFPTLPFFTPLLGVPKQLTGTGVLPTDLTLADTHSGTILTPSSHNTATQSILNWSMRHQSTVCTCSFILKHHHLTTLLTK